MKKIYFILIALAIVSLGFAQNDNLGFKAADQSVLTMPTAYTMPKGTHAFTSFEVILMQYSYALTDYAHLSAGMAFPVTSELFKTFSFGGKVNYLQKGQLESAVVATFNPNSKILFGANTLSYGNEDASAHFLTGGMMKFDERNKAILFGLGGIKSLSNRVSGLAELYYISSLDVYEEGFESSDSDEIMMGLGVRIKGSKMSWDFGAFRPLKNDTGDIFALPLLKATVLF